ncbi:MAG TPA: hypothetical protein VG963_24670, partial [Polyangiaceae bacterium]|nr:hypothetical protein [Polyangiaceae bacterium]
MDAFHASIEQRDHPELRGCPVIVGATSPRGVVAVASYEARRYGVRSAMPGFRARKLCPDAVYLPSNLGHHAAVSRQIQAIFHEFTPLVEPLALAEAFLDVSGCLSLFGGVEELGRELERRVQAATELNVSVGQDLATPDRTNARRHPAALRRPGHPPALRRSDQDDARSHAKTWGKVKPGCRPAHAPRQAVSDRCRGGWGLRQARFAETLSACKARGPNSDSPFWEAPCSRRAALRRPCSSAAAASP